MFNAASSVVDVGVAITLQNNFSKQANQISGDYSKMMREIQDQGRAISSSSANLTNFWGNVAGAMAQAYDYSAGVQKEIWMASKIAGATAQQESELMQLAKDVNEKTPLTAADVASAMRYLSMAGFKAEEVKAMVEPVSQLATILGTPVGGKGGVADMLTNIMSTFKIPIENVRDVTDDLYTAVTNANIDLTDLMASIKYGAADATNAGLSMRQLAAAVGVLGNAGIQGSMAGTALGNMFRFLQQSISGSRKAGHDWLQRLGLTDKDFYDAQGNMKDFDEILVTLTQHLSNLPDAVRTQAWNAIFYTRGSRAVRALVADLENGIENSTYFKISNRYDTNKGVVDRTLEEFNQTTPGRLEQFKSSLENLKVTLGEALTVFTPVLQTVTKIVDEIQSFIQSGFGGKVVLAAGILTAVNIIRQGFITIWRTIRMINTVFPKITSAVKSGAGGTVAWNKASQALYRELQLINHQLSIATSRLQGIVQMMAATRGFAYAGVNPLTGGPSWRDPRTGRFVSGAAARRAGLDANYFVNAPFNPSPMPGAGTGNGTSRHSGQTNGLTASRMARGRNIVRYGRTMGTAMNIGSTIGRGAWKGIATGVAFLGGPWALGITAALAYGNYLWDRNNQINEETRDRVADLNARMTLPEKRYIESLKQAIKELYKEGNQAILLDIRMNGKSYGLTQGGVLNFDGNSLNDPFMFETGT